jgi:hypothetical protein
MTFIFHGLLSICRDLRTIKEWIENDHNTRTHPHPHPQDSCKSTRVLIYFLIIVTKYLSSNFSYYITLRSLMSNYLQLIIFISLLRVYVGNDHFQQVKTYTVNNDDDLSPLSSEKELKLIQFISYLTYMQSTTTNITWNS